MREIRIPVPEDAVEAAVPGHIGRYFFRATQEMMEYTWVTNINGTDGAKYEYHTDEVRITSYSTHNKDKNGQVDIFTNPSIEFWNLQEQLQMVLDALPFEEQLLNLHE